MPLDNEQGVAPVRIMCDKLVDPDGFMQRVRYLHHHRDEEGHDEILLHDGRVFDCYSAPIKSTTGYNYGRVWYFRDITERKRTEEKLAHQALHDALTALPNRTLLRDRLQQAILTAHRGHRSLALLLMDLDRFKEVNDTFGHHCGDTLLQQISRRLLAAVQESDTVARLGGDEFAVLLPGADKLGATRIARKIVATLDEPF